MTKKEILAEAQCLGLNVTEKNTIAEIRKAIDEALHKKMVADVEKMAVASSENNIETEPIPEQETVSYEDHIKAGFVNLSQSEGLQKQGKRVVEIKNIGGFILHRLEKI